MTTTAAATAPGQAPAARPTIRYYANQLRPLRHRRRRGRQVVPWRDNPNSVLNLKEGYRKARLGVCTAITSTSKEFRCRVNTCLGIAWSLTSCFLLRLFSSCWLHVSYQLLPASPFLVVLVTIRQTGCSLPCVSLTIRQTSCSSPCVSQTIRQAGCSSPCVSLTIRH